MLFELVFHLFYSLPLTVPFHQEKVEGEDPIEVDHIETEGDSKSKQIESIEFRQKGNLK